MKIFEFEITLSMKVVAEDVQSAMEGVYEALPMDACRIVEEVDYTKRDLYKGEAGVLLNRVGEDGTISDELKDSLAELAASDTDEKPN
ncbi:MAG: hypothetical protein VXX11_03565 [Planctomycetota bacterium]|mgnify:CR=1 FL=1|nr:hypothetical protein [Planctomycetota bacterium]|tara:strand:- start:360 stop:623 length:264 start_codon:yes stop_codon:yes gene_type:complete